MADRHDDLPPFAGPEPGPLQFDPDDPRHPDNLPDPEDVTLN